VSIQARRERERADRHQLIVTTARELAEAEGWDAVTTRRLAERIEYSQPVLYSHFAGKDAIVKAVALEGFVELAGAMSSSHGPAANPREAFTAVARAYVAFAEANPALYLAMFTLSTDLPFARPDSPAPCGPRSARSTTRSPRWQATVTLAPSPKWAGARCTASSPSTATAG
jgi:AcrR family transcriptional regulator